MEAWREPGSDGWSPHDTAFHVAAWLETAAARLRTLLADLPAPSAVAKRAFEANTAEHYREHLGGLRRFGSGPSPSRQ